MPTAFVTGATGFLGLNLVEQLSERGWIVVAYHRPTSDTARVTRFPVRLTEGDIADFDAVAVSVDDKAVRLTRREFELLKFLVDNRNRVISRDRLLASIHDEFRDTTDRAVDSHVKNLRRKIDQALPGQPVIHSVYGIGYRFEVD